MSKTNAEKVAWVAYKVSMILLGCCVLRFFIVPLFNVEYASAESIDEAMKPWSVWSVMMWLGVMGGVIYAVLGLFICEYVTPCKQPSVIKEREGNTVIVEDIFPNEGPIREREVIFSNIKKHGECYVILSPSNDYRGVESFVTKLKNEIEFYRYTHYINLDRVKCFLSIDPSLRGHRIIIKYEN